LNLLYDPCLNCYFDPETGKYYELVWLGSSNRIKKYRVLKANWSIFCVVLCAWITSQDVFFGEENILTVMFKCVFYLFVFF
jgi:hypothetical protein